jgi:C-methyltransferase
MSWQPQQSDSGTSAHARVLEMSRAYVLARAIHIAAELGLADHVSDTPAPLHELARLTSTHPAQLERLLRLLAGHGIFSERAPGEFVATELSRVMRDDAPESLRPGLRMVNSAWWAAVGDLGHAVTTGEPAFGLRHGTPFFAYLKDHPDDQIRFDAGMACNSLASDRAIARAYDFSRATSIVDVGGGRGGLIRAILEQHAGVRGTLFDQPQVVERSVLPSTRLPADSWAIVGGNFFETIPAGADLYVIKGVLHDFDDERCLAILKNIRRAMPAGAKLLVIERTIAADDRPHQAKTIDLMMMALLGGRERTAHEWVVLLRGAELERGRQIATGSEFTISEAVIA